MEPTIDGVRQGLAELLAASEHERAQRGDLGRRLVEEGYTWPKIALQLDAACGELLK